MKIYIVTSGEYSDYGIRAVFTDQRKAELYCALHESKFDHHMVEEWETEYVVTKTNAKVMKIVDARVDNDGSIYINDRVFTFEKNFEPTVRLKYDYFSSEYYSVEVLLEADASEEKEKKIVFDTLAKWKYEQQMKG